MTASALSAATCAPTVDANARTVSPVCANERPSASTRELEAVFAKGGDRMPTAGLALGLTISAGLWALIALVVF